MLKKNEAKLLRTFALQISDLSKTSGTDPDKKTSSQ